VVDAPAKVLFQAAVGELRLSDSVRLVGWSLSTWMRPDGTAWPSVESIARRAGRNVRTVQRALRELQLLGLLSVHQRPGSTALYLATPATQVAGGGDTQVSPPAAGGGDTWVSPGGDTQVSGEGCHPGVTRRGFEGLTKGSRTRENTPAPKFKTRRRTGRTAPTAPLSFARSSRSRIG
jgi:hypothetical protein